MLSFHHEILVELFRGNSELAVALLRTCAGIAVDHTRVELGSIDLSQVASTEYRADAVVILYDLADRPVAGVIVEVQRQIERDKLLTWPAYVAALRAKLACPAVLLVIAPDPAVAAWARRPIELGHPGFLLTPVVIGFDDVPLRHAPGVRTGAAGLDRGWPDRLPAQAAVARRPHRAGATAGGVPPQAVRDHPAAAPTSGSLRGGVRPGQQAARAAPRASARAHR
jgi:hypothetical protein